MAGVTPGFGVTGTGLDVPGLLLGITGLTPGTTVGVTSLGGGAGEDAGRMGTALWTGGTEVGFGSGAMVASGLTTKLPVCPGAPGVPRSLPLTLSLTAPRFPNCTLRRSGAVNVLVTPGCRVAWKTWSAGTVLPTTTWTQQLPPTVATTSRTSDEAAPAGPAEPTVDVGAGLELGPTVALGPGEPRTAGGWGPWLPGPGTLKRSNAHRIAAGGTASKIRRLLLGVGPRHLGPLRAGPP